MRANTAITLLGHGASRNDLNRVVDQVREEPAAAWPTICSQVGRNRAHCLRPESATALLSELQRGVSVYAVFGRADAVQVDFAIDGLLLNGTWSSELCPAPLDWIFVDAPGPARDGEPPTALSLLLPVRDVEITGARIIARSVFVPSKRWISAQPSPALACGTPAMERDHGLLRLAIMLGLAEGAFDELAAGTPPDSLPEAAACRRARAVID